MSTRFLAALILPFSLNTAHAFGLCLAQLRAQPMPKDTVPDCDGWCRQYEDSSYMEFGNCQEIDGTVSKIVDRFRWVPSGPLDADPERAKEQKEKEKEEKKELKEWKRTKKAQGPEIVNPKYGRIVFAGDSGCSLHRATLIGLLQEELNTTVDDNCVCSADITDIMTKEKACSQYKDCQWSIIMDNGQNGAAGPEDMERFVKRELNHGKKLIINEGVNQFNAPAYAVYKEIVKKYEHTGRIWYINTLANPKFSPKNSKWYVGVHPSNATVAEIFVPAIAKVIKRHS